MNIRLNIEQGLLAEFIQMKYHGTCIVKETDSYRFHLSSWTSLTICLKIVLIPEREQIHSNEISWDLFSQGNFSRVANNLLPELVNVYQDKFVRLFVQVENSATSLDRHRSYGAGICDNLGRNPKFTLVT